MVTYGKRERPNVSPGDGVGDGGKQAAGEEGDDDDDTNQLHRSESPGLQHHCIDVYEGRILLLAISSLASPLHVDFDDERAWVRCQIHSSPLPLSHSTSE